MKGVFLYDKNASLKFRILLFGRKFVSQQIGAMRFLCVAFAAHFFVYGEKLKLYLVQITLFLICQAFF